MSMLRTFVLRGAKSFPHRYRDYKMRKSLCSRVSLCLFFYSYIKKIYVEENKLLQNDDELLLLTCTTCFALSF